MPVSLDTNKLVGQPVDRVDGRLKVTGRARYAADFPGGDNVAYAVPFQTSIAAGRVRSIDSGAALHEPGVIAVLTRAELPKLRRVSNDHNPGKPGQTLLPWETDEVHYAGQYLGVVVAETFTQAVHAAGLVKVTCDEAKPVAHLDDALGQSFEPKKMGRGDKPTSARGDADAALAAAKTKIDQTYSTPIENHNPMELSATVAAWDGDRLTLYDASQWVYGVRSVVSTWLGIPDDAIRVIDPYVGGGFGCKGSIWPHEVLAALASKHVNRPVKLMLTRPQMFVGVGYRPKTIQRVALAADDQGKLSSVIHECTSQTCAWRDEWVETATKQTRMLYACANVRTAQKLAPVNANTPTQMRAPGHATGTFALESAMDELAYALHLDPVELRLLNFAETDEDEKKPFSSKALRECYEQAAVRFGWSKRNPKPASMKDGRHLIGWGMATATYPTNRQEATAEVTIQPDGRAVVRTAAHDLGTGAYTVLTQLAAETLGLPLDRVKVELADTALPESPVAGGSQTTASAGSAVHAACQKALAALKERATGDRESPLFSRDAKAIQATGGRLSLKDDPSKGEAIASLLARNGNRPVSVKASSAPGNGSEPTEDAGSGKPKEEYSKHAWGAQFVEVRIDPLTREIRVPRVVGAFAAGRILNAKTAHSQILGGIVWGIGMGLLEHTVYDPNRAKVVNDNLADYLVPTNPDAPNVDCFFVEEKDDHVNPIGVKGVGELGITGVAAAIANAVYHATGQRVRDLPITIEKIM